MPQIQPRADLSSREAFDLLSNDRRRAVIVAVAEAESPLSLDDLTTLIASKEAQLTPEQVDPRTRRAIRSDLEGRHLPRLVDADVLQRPAQTSYAAGRNLEGVVAAADAAADYLR